MNYKAHLFILQHREWLSFLDFLNLSFLDKTLRLQLLQVEVLDLLQTSTQTMVAYSNIYELLFFHL